MAIIGIDLGTTNSLVCIFNNGIPELIPNALGEYLTPSVVGIDENGEVIVGQIAKERLIVSPKNTVASFKRYMGTEKAITIGNKVFSAPELSSFIIKSLVMDAEKYLGETVEEAVISVPAYFDDNGRNATKMAGELAGIKVERIINEPSAAALAYREDDGEDHSYMIIDLGGGTLDVSIVDMFDNIIEITAVAGDNNLGGDDFNKAIAAKFCQENDLQFNMLSLEAQAVILRQAEMCKIALNTSEQVAMSVIIDDKTYMSIFNNQKLVAASAQLFKRIELPIISALRDSHMGPDDIDSVIMVGGSSKMVSVRKFVEKLLGCDMSSRLDPDRVVAIGAGIVAGIKSRNEEIKDLILTDICPFTLGTATNNESNPKDPFFSPIIEKNSALPASMVRSYVTVCDNQTKMDFEIYQGDNMYCRDNVKLGELNVTLPKGPKGSESIEARFTYDINGILQVDIKVDSTGEVYNKVIVNKNIKFSDAELKKRIEYLNTLHVLPKDKEENLAIMTRAERLYKECNVEMREMISSNMQYFSVLLSEQNESRIRKTRNKFAKFLDMIEMNCSGFNPGEFEFSMDDDEGDYEE